VEEAEERARIDAEEEARLRLKAEEEARLQAEGVSRMPNFAQSEAGLHSSILFIASGAATALYVLLRVWRNMVEERRKVSKKKHEEDRKELEKLRELEKAKAEAEAESRARAKAELRVKVEEAKAKAEAEAEAKARAVANAKALARAAKQKAAEAAKARALAKKELHKKAKAIASASGHELLSPFFGTGDLEPDLSSVLETKSAANPTTPPRIRGFNPTSPAGVADIDFSEVNDDPKKAPKNRPWLLPRTLRVFG